jgi:formyl-CoA transferase
VGPILDYEQVFSDPHTAARNMVVEMEHPVEGTLRGLGIPVKLSDTPGSVRTAAPLLGADTDDILGDLGYSADEVSRMHQDGAA